jgi:hypothetical protein
MAWHTVCGPCAQRRLLPPPARIIGIGIRIHLLAIVIIVVPVVWRAAHLVLARVLNEAHDQRPPIHRPALVTATATATATANAQPPDFILQGSDLG